MEAVIYSNHTIDFVKLAVEYCAWVEGVRETEKDTFVDQGTKILPMLYLKAVFLPEIEDDYESDLEIGITEERYLHIKNRIADLIGENDLYLETFHPDMQFSDTPIAVTISEDLADIYQDLGNFIFAFKSAQQEIMNDSLSLCLSTFKEYWGQKLLNALRALHHVKYSIEEEN